MRENKTKTSRKKRTDRTHAIYTIVIGKYSYLGITAKTQSTVLKSVKVRFQKHCERARNENKNWPLYNALRKYGVENAEVFLLETVRGKKQAHILEVQLIKKMKPSLNLASR